MAGYGTSVCRFGPITWVGGSDPKHEQELL